MDDLTHTVAIRGAATTLGASASWSLANLTSRNPQRTSTIGLVGLVTTQLGQTLLESRDPLVIGTCAGTFATLAALITTPGVSGLVGCVPLGPLGWLEGVAPAVGLTFLTASKPDYLLRMASLIGRRVAGYAIGVDRRLDEVVADVVASISTWAQEHRGADPGVADDSFPATVRELVTVG